MLSTACWPASPPVVDQRFALTRTVASGLIRYMSTSPSRRPVGLVHAPPRRPAHPPGPCAMVIFGASGDLTRRLLVPALYNLARTGLIPEHFAIIGVDIAERSAEDWRGSLRDDAAELRRQPEQREPHRRDRRCGVAAPDRRHVLRAGRLQRPRPVREAAAAPAGRRARRGRPAATACSILRWPTASSAPSSSSSAMPACWTRSCAMASRSAGDAW